MNLKLHPTAVKGMEGAKKLLALTQAYMRKGGFHIQYNVVDSKLLRDAQKNPDKYRDLMVRVAGFTQYSGGTGTAGPVVSHAEHYLLRRLGHSFLVAVRMHREF